MVNTTIDAPIPSASVKTVIAKVRGSRLKNRIECLRIFRMAFIDCSIPLNTENRAITMPKTIDDHFFDVSGNGTQLTAGGQLQCESSAVKFSQAAISA